MIIFAMVVGISISTNAETVKVMDEASTDGSFTIAQTSGMERRGERRDTRQNCRQANGAVGADKRNCKQRDARKSRPLPRGRLSLAGRFTGRGDEPTFAPALVEIEEA
jgi:hypothetical protein